MAASAVTLYAKVIGRTGFTGLVTVLDAGVRALVAVPLIVQFGVWGYLLAPLVATPASAGLTLVLGRSWLGFVPNLRKNAAVGLWALAAFAAALPFRAVSDFLALAVYVAALAALARRFVAREDALELVELAGGVPIVGPLARRIGNAVVARLFPATRHV